MRAIPAVAPAVPRRYRDRSVDGKARAARGQGISNRTGSWSADGFAVRLTLPRRASAPASLVDAGCVVVLVLAVLVDGLVVAFGLPNRVELLADAAVAVLLGFVLVSLLRGGAVVPLPYLAIAYAVLIAIAATRSDDALRMLVSLRNFLFWPTLALGISALGPREARNRAVVLAALALAGLEFAVTIVQAATVDQPDLVAGTFGDFRQGSLSFAILTGACLAVGVYASGVGGRLWLLLGAALPLFSVWASTKLVVFIVPATLGVVALSAWWTRRRDPPHRPRLPAAAAPVATAIAGSVCVAVVFAVARPADFGQLSDPTQIGTYLGAPHIISVPPNGGAAKPGDKRRHGGGESKPESRAAIPFYERGTPGRLEQFDAATGLIARSPVSFLFGTGLGASTWAVNLGVHLPKERGARLGSYTDFGTLLVEVGWLGAALGAICVLGLMLGSLGAARRATPGSWTRALLVAYPGILVAMTAEAMYSPPFRNIGSATLFWMLTGLALAAIMSDRRELSAS